MPEQLVLCEHLGGRVNDDAKRAKAAAKAAKAEAKALRPFYKKKRVWILAVIGIMVIAGVAGQSDTSTTSSGSSSESDAGNAPTDTVSSGLGSKDATADIVDFECGSPDAIGFSYPEVTIKNNSSKASNYVITVVYESSDGSTRYDDSMLIVNSLNPGQTIVEKGLPVSDVPDGAVCKVTEVQRTAA